MSVPIPDRDTVLALSVGLPAGFVSGFCVAPLLYLATYKDQWTHFTTMLTGGAILTVLIAGLLAAVWFCRFRLFPEPEVFARLKASRP